MAANDRKLYRMWRADPEAYERQYAELDKQYLEAQKKKAAAKRNSSNESQKGVFIER